MLVIVRGRRAENQSKTKWIDKFWEQLLPFVCFYLLCLFVF